MTAAEERAQTLRWTKWLAIWTGLLFLVTALSAVFIGIELLIKNHEDVEAREQFRAYLSFVGLQTLPGLELKTSKPLMQLTAQIRNLGGTRTLRTTGWQSLKYFEGGVPNNFDYDRPYDDVKKVDSPIGPNGTLPFGAVTISGSDLYETSLGKGQAILWGKVEYTTIYAPSEVHARRWCFLINVGRTPDAGDVVKETGVKALASLSQFLLTPLPYRDECNQGD